jgi:DNA-binding winged helix-turn-helix (wHTH) protein/TolB-like protein
MAQAGSTKFRFDIFEVDTRAGELRKDGTRVPLQEQPFQVLAVLLQRSGELVRRDELRQQVWPQDTFVEFDHALNTAVKKIRIALGDCADSPRYVETIPKRGYRFVASITSADDLRPAQTQGNPSGPTMPHAARRLTRPAAGIALALTVVVSIVLVGMRWRTDTRDVADKRIVLAVLPLENWSENAGYALLCDGITEEVITQVGGTEATRLAVLPWAAALPYRHTTKTVAEVSRELHADYLVEGNLRGDERRIRVTVELIRVSDEARIWGESFDREPGDTLALESEVAGSMVGKIKSALVSAPISKR